MGTGMKRQQWLRAARRRMGSVVQNLPYFAAALAARRASPSTVRQARVMTLGHSWTAGGGAGTNDGRDPGGSDVFQLLNCIPNSWSQRLCSYLTTAGVTAVRNGFMGQQRAAIDAYLLNATDPRVAFSAGVVPSSNPNFIGCRPMSLVGNGTNEWFEFTPGFNFTQFKVWGQRSAGVYSDNVEVFVNDVSVATIDASVGGTYYAFPGTVASDSKYNFPGNKIRLVNHHATKSFQISGIECFGGDLDNSDVFLTMAGYSSAQLADLVAGGANDYAAINAIPNYKCDLLIVEAMVNDMNTANTIYNSSGGNNETALAAYIDTWKTNMGLLYAKNPNCDIIIIGDPDAPTGAASPYIVQRYHTAAQEVIAAQGRGLYIDLRLIWGTYSESVARGYRNYPSDVLHPSKLGHDTIGDQVGAVVSSYANLAPTAPVNTSLPTITGTAQVGQTLTGTDGTWTQLPTGFTRQWFLAGAPISGATSSTYVPVTGDIGSTLTYGVTASNSGGSSAIATSAATSAVIASGGGAVEAILALTSLTNITAVGDTYTAGAGLSSYGGRAYPGSQTLPAGTDGYISIDHTQATNGGVIVGFSTTPNAIATTNLVAFLQISTSSGFIRRDEGSNPNAATSVNIEALQTAGTTVRYRVGRVGTVWTVQRTTNSGGTWTVIYTFATTNVAALYPVYMCVSNQVFKNPRALGVA